MIRIRASFSEIIISLIVSFCVMAVFISIISNFLKSNKEETVYKKKSIVETGTMTLFFIAYYLVLVLKIGNIYIENITIKYTLIVLGLILLILGCIVNIIGRRYLGDNWANHIKIYESHTLVTKGVYKIVRHPLYASIIWMFYAGSLIYRNIMCFVLNTFVFIPFMYYRAKQEETLLMKRFNEYNNYKKVTGMFFPKIIKG